MKKTENIFKQEHIKRFLNKLLTIKYLVNCIYKKTENNKEFMKKITE